MDAQQFLAEFGHIANAPDGMSRLREMVLQLAISGRLASRDETDTPVDEALAAVAVDRAAYESKFQLRATRPHPPLDTPPFAIPDHWQWVRLEQLVLYIQRGKGPKYAERGAVAVVSQKCVQWSGFDIARARCIDDDSVDAYGKERFLRDGDLLWNSTGTGTAGRVAVVRGVAENEAVADSHVTVVRLASSLPRYVWCVIASPWVQARIHPGHPESLVSGTTQQVELATSTARALGVPCPPVGEQGRIVAKVDELMALCDQLEHQQQDRRKLQNTLRQFTLQTLVSVESPHELQTSWQRLQANFGRLITDAKDVDALRQAVLQLAVRGLLGSQNRKDEPAHVLLEQIAAEKARLAKAGKASKPKPLPPVTEGEVPFPLPDGWAWARFADVADIASNLVQPRDHPTAPHIAPDSIEKGSGRLLGYRTIAEDGVRSSKHQFYPGQILYSKIRPSLSKVIIVDFDGLCSADMYPIDVWIDRRYLHRYMLSGAFLTQVITDDNRLAMPKVNQGQLSVVLVPVPPLDEQRRIVGKVDRIMQVCESLEEQLYEAGRTARRLAMSAVAALTGIAIEQDENTAVKAPQTELITSLRLATPPDVKAQAPLAKILARHEGEMAARDLWQRFGGEIDAFYAQLKTEVTHGWIAEPEVAHVCEKAAAQAAKA